jgi:hypothetical protein
MTLDHYAKMIEHDRKRDLGGANLSQHGSPIALFR